MFNFNARCGSRIVLILLLALPGLTAAQLVNSTALGDLNHYLYDVTGTVYDTRTGFNIGPSSTSNRYAQKRQYFNVRNGSEHGVLWQNENTMELFITWFGASLDAPTTVSVPNTDAEELAAATHDDTGNIYYLTIETGAGVGPFPGDPALDDARTATLYKVDSNGDLLMSVNPDTSINGLNMVRFYNMADMHWATDTPGQPGKLGLFLARTMHFSQGGNHQGGIAVVFDAGDTNFGDMSIVGGTSSHSWDNYLTARPSGEFLGIDLGDNFPRGVHLHKFTDTQKQSRVAFNLKTLHGTTPRNTLGQGPPGGGDFPLYDEINVTGGPIYYKWSNDNETYSELAAVMESGGAFTLVFAAEPDAAGKALNNARVGAALNDARNVGLVQVIGNFETAANPGSSLVGDDMVLSGGTPPPFEEGEFYSFTGGKKDQRNAGVVWLTSYSNKDTENASRVRAVDLSDGNILVLWEKWTSTTYVSTYGMKVSPAGEPLVGPIDLGTVLRFDRRGDLWRDGDSVYSLAGSAAVSKLELFVLKPGIPGTACGVTDVTVGSITYTSGQVITCTGIASLQTSGVVRVESGANVTYIAPIVTLKDGFSAETGATFRVNNP